MPDIKFTFWMAAGNMRAMARTLTRWYQYVKEIAGWPIQQFDIDTAALFVVDLIAWERDVQRFNGEPEWLYRLRVKHAYANARDAGTVAGFYRIWQRMGLGYLTVRERIEGRDWDIVELLINEKGIAENSGLLDIIVEKYGRTCRRYEWTTMHQLPFSVRATHFGHESETVAAVLYNTNTEYNMPLTAILSNADNTTENIIARI